MYTFGMLPAFGLFSTFMLGAVTTIFLFFFGFFFWVGQDIPAPRPEMVEPPKTIPAPDPQEIPLPTLPEKKGALTGPASV